MSQCEKYITSDDNSIRYVLGRYDSKPLIVFGINPSTATDEKNDRTITKTERIAERRCCDGFLMFNIYPLRATKLDGAFPKIYDPAIHQRNIELIQELIPEGAEIVAAWGESIIARDYFPVLLHDIDAVAKKKNAKWICLNRTKYGHPRHPCYIGYDSITFEDFDMDDYMKRYDYLMK